MKFPYIVILTISVLPFIASMSIAFDFYGATVSDKETPTYAWNVGIMGVRPIISDLALESPAKRAGFANGDIILSINNKDVKRSSDLKKFTGDTLKVYVYSEFKWKTLIIDKVAIKAENADHIEVEKPAVIPVTIQSPTVNVAQDELPPLQFNDTSLDDRYGKTTPAELARQKQNAERIDREDRLREADESRKEARRILAEKLAKTECTCTGRIPDECGTGRTCVCGFTKDPGECHSQKEADRIVAESHARIRENQQQQKLDDIQDKVDKLDRSIRLGF